MTLNDIDPELYYINLALSFAVTWEGYPVIFMGDTYGDMYLWLTIGEGL